MPQISSILYKPQIGEGYCLAACAQMVLHYLGIQTDQMQLAQQLSVKPGVGAPASRIQQLASDTISVIYETGKWETIEKLINQKTPVIAMIQAGELHHWQGESFQHAVVVIGFDSAQVWLLDPAVSSYPLVVSIDEFMLAWGEMDYHYAVVSGSPESDDM